MKQWFKRIGAVLLTLVMFASMLPAVYAEAETLSTSVTGLTASWEYTNTGGGSATWTSGGTTISCTSKGTAAKTNVSALTLTNNSGTEAMLSFDYSLTTGGSTAATRASLSGAITVSNQASASDSFTATLANGDSVVISLKSPRGASASATFTITGLALVSTSAADPILTFKPAVEGGSYTLDGETVTEELTQEVTLNSTLTLSAEAAEGYVFYGWYDENSEKYLSQDEVFALKASEDAVIIPVFVSDEVALFGVGSARYDDLTEAGAVAAASSTHKTVVLLNDGTLTGDHVIPEGVTLLIPYDDANTSHGATPACTSSDNNSVEWVEPTAYRTLTMDADATITVNGALEVGGRHAAAGGAPGMYAAPTDALGYIYMTAGSHIEVNGDLYCWGYIYGDGTVTATDGAGIYEVFQVLDFRGGNATLALAADLLVFPMTQYYVQNVEVATTYEYGATAYVTTTMFVSSQCVTAPPIKFIGEGAMFQPSEGSYIVKEYDPETDTLNLDACGDCVLSTMMVELAGNSVDTSNFVLPITNNINITVKSGTATLKQDIAMLPGSSLTIDQGATLEIATTETPCASMSAGYSLIVYDSENWTTGVDVNTFEMVDGLNYVHPSCQLVPIKYSPSEHKTRTTADIKDVVMDINGTVVADGYFYSTVTWADPAAEDFSIVSGGATVISSEGTGKVALNSGAGVDILCYQYDQEKDTAYKSSEDYDAETGGTLYYMIPLASVQLQNGDGTLLDTTGAEAGSLYVYCATHDHWSLGECTLPATVDVMWSVNGEILTVEVDYGTVPVYPDGTPTKGMDDMFHYNFVGWSTLPNDLGYVSDPVAATETVTYYAVFEPENHVYGTTSYNGYHECECGKPASCYDLDNDGDHLCDLGCGEVKSEHTGGTATCSQQAVCIECGESYGDVLDHTYAYHCSKVCSVCNAENPEPADCVSNAEYSCQDGVCANCGEACEATAEHTYDDEYDADCNVCGDVREVPEKPDDSDEILYGDANGDGSVNARDVALLQQYVTGWEVTLDEEAADANGDGSVNARDVALLQQYVTGWDVTLGPDAPLFNDGVLTW